MNAIRSVFQVALFAAAILAMVMTFGLCCSTASAQQQNNNSAGLLAPPQVGYGSYAIAGPYAVTLSTSGGSQTIQINGISCNTYAVYYAAVAPLSPGISTAYGIVDIDTTHASFTLLYSGTYPTDGNGNCQAGGTGWSTTWGYPPGSGNVASMQGLCSDPAAPGGYVLTGALALSQ